MCRRWKVLHFILLRDCQIHLRYCCLWHSLHHISLCWSIKGVPNTGFPWPGCHKQPSLTLIFSSDTSFLVHESFNKFVLFCADRCKLVSSSTWVCCSWWRQHLRGRDRRTEILPNRMRFSCRKQRQEKNGCICSAIWKSTSATKQCRSVLPSGGKQWLL